MKQLFRKIVVCKRVKFDETAHFLPHRILKFFQMDGVSEVMEIFKKSLLLILTYATQKTVL